MTWNIVSDSSCDLRTASFHSSCVRFETVPLRIQVGGREFVDDDALSVPALLSAMAVEKAASSSACPSPADFAGAFERGDRTVCFTRRRRDHGAADPPGPGPDGGSGG